ncbi:hypothetical protein [Butyrivibrio sp. INlla16]|uniref:hypothetical protein n=1 Tax=Butyrivibrio sp. INlla16 TaxID=1520807 RepID=UPI0014813BAA|nr:hypothetical protein [Butyrivibrio sp. INlla16]
MLTLNYGIEFPSLKFLRDGGGHTYIVNGKNKYLITSLFEETTQEEMDVLVEK